MLSNFEDVLNRYVNHFQSTCDVFHMFLLSLHKFLCSFPQATGFQCVVRNNKMAGVLFNFEPWLFIVADVQCITNYDDLNISPRDMSQ